MLYLFLWCSFNNSDSINRLQIDVQALIDAQPAAISVALSIPSRNETVMIRAGRQMHAASTMKTPVMMQLCRLVDQGVLNWDQPVAVVNQFRSIVDGSPYTMAVTEDDEKELYQKLGTSVPLSRLIEWMITQSSNLATNILIQLAGAEETTQLMRKLGARDIQVRRGVEDLKAYRLGLNNEAHARDMVTIMLAAAESVLFTPNSREQMVAILRRGEHREMIPAGIPKEHGVLVGNKTGRISSVEHDAAIVDLPSGLRYGLVIFCTDFAGEEGRREVIQTGRQISNRIYRYAASL